jgi:hypothetical protein
MRELNEVLIELTPCSRQEPFEMELHIRIKVNNEIFQKYITIPSDDMKSIFDTVFDYSKEELRRLILEK